MIDGRSQRNWVCTQYKWWLDAHREIHGESTNERNPIWCDGNTKNWERCDENTSDRSPIWNYENTINVKRVGDPISCDENTSVNVKKAAPPVCYYGEKFPLHWFSMACAMQHENNH